MRNTVLNKFSAERKLREKENEEYNKQEKRRNNIDIKGTLSNLLFKERN